VAQHDYVIANGTGAAVRSDLNNALAAIVSQNSGATAPATTYAYQWWADTTTGLLKLRNAANNAWITLFQLDGEWSTLAVENGSAAAPSIYFKDSGTDTGIYSPGADQVAVATNGTGRLFVDSSGRVGVGTSSPNVPFQVIGSATVTDAVIRATNSGATQSMALMSGGLRMDGGAPIQIYQGGTEVARIDTSGRLGIGSNAPTQTLDVNGNVRAGGGGYRAFGYYSDGTSAYNVGIGTTGNVGYLQAVNVGVPSELSIDGSPIKFRYGAGFSEAARIDTSGRLLVGTSSSSSVGALVQVRAGAGNNHIEAIRSSDDAGGPAIWLTKSRGTAGSPTEISNGDQLGFIVFRGHDGVDYKDAAYIYAEADGTWTDGGDTTDNPSRLVFSTCPDSGSSPVERMRIKNNGVFHINTGGNAPSGSQSGLELHPDGYIFTSVNAGGAAYFNRNTNDGGLVEFRQDNVAEGSISVSGSTVSYNGAHLSRWSQLPGGAERTEILRGSVLSNIDEMCEWGKEDNEQLNRMKVSDVEGDKNVSGVFQAWDDDDDTYTNDFYCAMTGDFIIRIAEGVTVERGDLLISAGDGTAKPQDDDIIRSKTIAKVTSTNVSCTYDDGSYCVPCVLMAC
jgi:hypothetical protein